MSATPDPTPSEWMGWASTAKRKLRATGTPESRDPQANLRLRVIGQSGQLPCKAARTQQAGAGCSSSTDPAKRGNLLPLILPRQTLIKPVRVKLVETQASQLKGFDKLSPNGLTCSPFSWASLAKSRRWWHGGRCWRREKKGPFIRTGLDLSLAGGVRRAIARSSGAVVPARPNRGRRGAWRRFRVRVRR